MATVFQDILRAFRVRTPGMTDFDYPGNTNASLSCDANGALLVAQSPAPQSARWNDTDYNLAQPVLHNTACTLTQIGGYNNSAVPAYLLVFDNNVAPILGAVPIQSFNVPAGASFAWTPAEGGRNMGNGVTYGVSSTPSTYTALAQPFWVFAEGLDT